ncbi:hypothetical protein IWW38_001889, partial [Coemansia aciculifera]
LVEQLRVASEASVRANIDAGDSPRLVEVLGDFGSLVVLGEAMQVESTTVQSTTCVEALFPVFVDGRATPLFVQAAGSAVPGVIESASVFVRLASGEVEQIRLDVQAVSSNDDDDKGRRRGGRRVQDADYRDL